MKDFKDNYQVKGNYSIYTKGSTMPDVVMTSREKELRVRYIVATFGNLKQQPMAPKYYGRQVQTASRPKRRIA